MVVRLKSYLESELIPLALVLRDRVNDRSPCGTTRVSGSAITRTVTFQEPERDDQYLVTLTVQGVSSGADLDSALVWVTDKRVDGFDIETRSSPGVGEWADVGWAVAR